MTWVKVFQKNWLHSIPSAGLQSGASTKTGGNKHNIAIIPPKSLYDTYLQMFSRCPDEKSYSREFHTLEKSFITILSSSDNCYFSKQSLPPEWVPGDIVLEMIIQQAKNYAPSFSSYKTSMQRLLTEISEITLLISHCHKQADMETDFIR